MELTIEFKINRAKAGETTEEGQRKEAIELLNYLIENYQRNYRKFNFTIINEATGIVAEED